MELQESLENEMIILAALSDTENKSNVGAVTSILKQQLAKIPLKVALGMGVTLSPKEAVF